MIRGWATLGIAAGRVYGRVNKKNREAKEREDCLRLERHCKVSWGVWSLKDLQEPTPTLSPDTPSITRSQPLRQCDVG
jgi:hypothetical protein